MGIPLLGQVPIVQGIRESGDSGKPAALSADTPSGKAFSLLSSEVEKALNKRNMEQEPTQKVEITTMEVIKERVEKALEKIRPYLVADGGDIALVDISDDMVVRVEMKGACNGCPFSMQTLKAGVEIAVKKEVPEIKEVVDVNE